MGLANPLHIAIIAALVLLVFGAKRLPDLGRGLGEGMRGFKDSVTSAPAPEQHTLTPQAATALSDAPAPPPTSADPPRRSPS